MSDQYTHEEKKIVCDVLTNLAEVDLPWSVTEQIFIALEEAGVTLKFPDSKFWLLEEDNTISVMERTHEHSSSTRMFIVAKDNEYDYARELAESYMKRLDRIERASAIPIQGFKT